MRFGGSVMRKFKGHPARQFFRRGRKTVRKARPPRPAFLSRIASADRRALLLGTALATSCVFFAGITLPAAPAQAQTQVLVEDDEDTIDLPLAVNGIGNSILVSVNIGAGQSQTNTGDPANTTITYNGVDFPVPVPSDNFFQYIDVDQSNRLTVDIIVTNTPDINDPVNGIDIRIETDVFNQTNTANPVSITNIADIDVTDVAGATFEQRADLDQSNLTDLSIDIDNSGNIGQTIPPPYALQAEIDNLTNGQSNYAYIDISNTGDVIASSFTQRAGGVSLTGEENPITQSNRLANLIDIDNRGALNAADDDGLHAHIENEYSFQENDLVVFLENSDADPLVPSGGGGRGRRVVPAGGGRGTDQRDRQ